MIISWFSATVFFKSQLLFLSVHALGKWIWPWCNNRATFDESYATKIVGAIRQNHSPKPFWWIYHHSLVQLLITPIVCLVSCTLTVNDDVTLHDKCSSATTRQLTNPPRGGSCWVVELKESERRKAQKSVWQLCRKRVRTDRARAHGKSASSARFAMIGYYYYFFAIGYSMVWLIDVKVCFKSSSTYFETYCRVQ